MLSSEIQKLIENKEWKKNTEEDFKVEININLKSKEKIKVKIFLKTGDIVEYIGTDLSDYLNFEMQFIRHWKFYKTFTKGKDFLKEKWIINGQKCRFMTTKEMFNNNKRGVYSAQELVGKISDGIRGAYYSSSLILIK